MIKLTTENTQNAIARAKELRPKVIFIQDRVFEVKSANNENSYTVRFDVQNGEKFGQCECKASERGLVCYHIARAAQVNIIRQSVKRQSA
ncbi:MAG TPA: SWIM zinc finger family protein [Pyrinomonadaceae bacterium]|nr:SWIM zinc finger family protein [Pyrinomonadaceae bacterium]